MEQGQLDRIESKLDELLRRTEGLITPEDTDKYINDITFRSWMAYYIYEILDKIYKTKI